MSEELSVNDKLKIKGYVKIYQFPSDLVKTYDDYLKLECKEKYLVHKGKNTLTTPGMAIICQILGGGTSDISHCAVGTGTPSASALGTEVGTRIAITHKYPINNEYHLDTFYGKNDPNTSSNILTETGIFNALTGGTMYSSKTISITKNTTITMTVAWTWSLAAV